LLVPVVPSQSFHVYQSYVTLLPKEAAPRRSEIIRQLKEHGVETNIGTWHMPLTTYFRTRYGYQAGDFPNTDRVFASSLTLPLYEKLIYEEQCLVINQIHEVIR
jgi:dTDP-4-amino-4,6-dideoxygalactose transaminase